MKKEIFSLLGIILLISVPAQVFAQENLPIVKEQEIVFEIYKESNASVTHIIELGMWGETSPKLVSIFPYSHSDISVTDEDGNNVPYSYNKESFEDSEYIILPKKENNVDVLVKYKIEDFLTLNNGVWGGTVEHHDDVQMIFDEEIKMIFVNNRPIDISDVKGINCVGCVMNVKFFQDEEMKVKNIFSMNNEFDVLVLGQHRDYDLRLSEMNGEKILSFNIDKKGIVVLEIPLGLIMNPFTVYLTDTGDLTFEDTDQIFKSEFSQNNTHVKLFINPESKGTINIFGATESEHEKLLSELEKRESKKIESSGVPLPLPGTSTGKELAEKMSVEKEDNMEVFSEWEVQQKQQDNTIIYVIAGIIAVVIIIGIIVKIKKN